MPRELKQRRIAASRRLVKNYVVDFLSTSEGLQLNRAFITVKDVKIRRKIVNLVKTLSEDSPESSSLIVSEKRLTLNFHPLQDG